MEPAELAERTIDLLAEAMNHANVRMSNEWASKLLRIVAGQLSLAGRSGDLEAFRDRPGDRARRVSLAAAWQNS